MNKEIMKRLPFAETNVEGIELWLDQMALKGLFLCDTAGTSWYFREGEPEAIRYRLDKVTEKGAMPSVETVSYTHLRGWQTAIHLTGGRGIDISVDALSEAEEEEPGRDLRHFILHASSSSKENIKKCVRHEIGCGAQAVGGYEFGGETDYKILLDGGMLVAEGSDAPALPMNWMKGLHFLVSRRAKDCLLYTSREQDSIRSV